ncbi:alpha-1,2-fucosyltransferase [Microbacterium sp. NIBRBAC000506063]|uniref:alpha-1,2-fucosyltransferase n=1 Tax=Microbacterium sp. NIBRBAC000506063 TaxID=2734618 RepID=UPI001BB7D45E|nr:alpha-1,2-fucosyltransferase [Microbacterium sp. NIBRBAC000506063]QTV80195.1 alpha-1,2-fucosyltransferase [Microbacterium sp. NIBRBAC000506063]
MTWFPKNDDIVLSLQGGLGNQLFEWAFGRALSAQGRRVIFDRVRLRGDRPYALGDLVERSAMMPRPVGAVLALAERAGWINDTSALRQVKQAVSGFDRSVIERSAGRSYLRGYFQSPQYFTSIAAEVRESVAAHLSTMLTARGLELAEELRADPSSVAVHVRRGDYISDPNAAKRHGVLDGSYYDQALARMDALGATRRVWFSDDPEWVRAHLAREGTRSVHRM